MRKQINYRGFVPDSDIVHEVGILMARLEKEQPAVSSCRLTVDRRPDASAIESGSMDLSIELAIDHEPFRLQHHSSGDTVEGLREFSATVRDAVKNHVRSSLGRDLPHGGAGRVLASAGPARRVHRV
jgi:hypothetical protein